MVRMRKLFCTGCGLEMRLPNDCYCRDCRNAYARQWRAKQRHGEGLEGYAPKENRRTVKKRPAYREGKP